MATWSDYGPAEFDRARCPKGAKTAPAEQAGLFVLARVPVPAKAAPVPAEMDGQGALSLFAELGPVGPHAPADGTDLCCAPVITCGECGRPVRRDGGRWRADIDGLGAELACYPECPEPR